MRAQTLPMVGDYHHERVFKELPHAQFGNELPQSRIRAGDPMIVGRTIVRRSARSIRIGQVNPQKERRPPFPLNHLIARAAT